MTQVNNQANNPLLEQDSEILVFHQQNNIEKQNVKKKQEGCYDRHGKKINCSWCCLGVLLVIFSIQTGLLPPFLRTAVKEGLQNGLIFTYVDYSDENFRNWANTEEAGVPLWMEARFFHVENPWEVLHEGKYPKFHVTDVLIYNEIDIKVNISYSDDGETVSWNKWDYYTYNDTLSVLDKETNLTVFAPWVSALWAQKDWYGMERFKYDGLIDSINLLAKDEAMELLFWNKTAEEILFDIYNISFDFSYNSDNHPNVTINETINFEFGLLGNTTREEANDHKTYEVVNTGFWDNSRYMEIQSLGLFDGEYVTCWNPAVKISPGHDDYFGPYSISKESQPLVWDSQVYKNTITNFNKTVDFHGIELWEFTVQLTPQFLNFSLAPENAQYYQYGWSGVENASICAGIPIFISFAEFLGAPDFINLNKYMGLSQDPSWDAQIYVDIEQHSGAIMKANKTLQLNTYLRNIPGRRNNKTDAPFGMLLTNAPEIDYEKEGLIVPIVMFSEYEELTESQAKDYKGLVIDTLNMADVLEIIGYVSIGLFAVYTMICCYIFGMRHAKSKLEDQYVYM